RRDELGAGIDRHAERRFGRRLLLAATGSRGRAGCRRCRRGRIRRRRTRGLRKRTWRRRLLGAGRGAKDTKDRTQGTKEKTASWAHRDHGLNYRSPAFLPRSARMAARNRGGARAPRVRSEER